MKFILYDSPEYFTDIKKSELVECVITAKAYVIDSEEESIANSIKLNHPSSGFDYSYVSNEVVKREKQENQKWNYQTGQYVPTGEFFDVVHLKIKYLVKVETVEITSLEELQKFSEQFGEPIIINYGVSVDEYGLPSVHVYDDYIE